MDKNEFRNLVEKYKNELLAVAKKSPFKNTEPKIMTVNAATDLSQNQIGTIYPNTNEPPETYQQFMDRNNQTGHLKIQAFAAKQTIPVDKVHIKISRKFTDEEKTFFEGETNSSGIIENIELPAPAEALSEKPSDTIPYSTYDVSASHPNFSLKFPPNVQIFSNTKAILPVRLVPNDMN